MSKLLAIALCAGLAMLSAAASAQNWPERPIRLMMPLASGSAVDVATRIVADKMGTILGQRIVVENEPGASGMIGARSGARAAPDGYTLLAFNDSVLTMLPNMRADVGYDVFTDFAPVIRLASIEWVLVTNPAFAPNSVAELVAFARQKPGTIDYGSGGYGSPQHVAMEMFQRAVGVRMTHVPYRGPTPAVNDLVAGHVSLMFTALSTVTGFLPDGRLRVLAATSPRRLPQLPGVPTVAEAGVPGFQFATWCALMVPARTPPAIIARLNTAAGMALDDKSIRDRLVDLGFATVGGTPEALSAYLREEYARTGEIIRAANIHME